MGRDRYGSDASRRRSDEDAADALATVLDRLGVAIDTGDFAPMRQAVFSAEVAAYAGDDAPPMVDSAPFTVLDGDLADRRLALISLAASSGSVTTRWAWTGLPSRSRRR